MLGLAFCFYLEKAFFPKIINQRQEELKNDFQNKILYWEKNLETEAHHLLNPSNSNKKNKISGKPEDVLLFAFNSNGDALFWNNNRLSIDSVKALAVGIGLSKIQNAWYLHYKEVNKLGQSSVSAIAVQGAYSISNAYLENDLTPAFANNQNCILSKKIDSGNPILSLSGQYLVNVSFEVIHFIPIWYMVFVGLSFILFVIASGIIYENIFKRSITLGIILGSSFTFLLRLLMMNYKFPSHLYALQIFNPELYASSVFYPSLGDLMINSFCYLLNSIIFYRYIIKFKTRTKSKNAINILVFFLAFLFSGGIDISFHTIQDLIINSRISFDLNNLLAINIYSFFGALSIGFFFITGIIMFAALRRFCNNNFSGKSLFIYCTGGLLTYVLLRIIIFNSAFNFSILSLLFVYILVGFEHLYWLRTKYAEYLYPTIIFSILGSICFFYFGAEKEKDSRRLFASKLTSRIDIKAEQELQGIEKALLNDIQIKKIFSQVAPERNIENRIGQLYLTGYLNNFENTVFLFDSLGQNLNQNFSLTLAELQNLFYNKSSSGICNYFRFAKSPENFFGYIGRLEYKSEKGVLYILLNPKYNQNENLFPALLTDNKLRPSKTDYEYAYAMYRNGTLINSFGRYPYESKLDKAKVNEDFLWEDINGYNHLFYSDPSGLVIVVSKKSGNPLILLAASVTLLIIFLTVLVFLLAGDFIIRLALGLSRLELTNPRFEKSVRWKFRDFMEDYGLFPIPFANRIMAIILSLIFFSTLLTAYFTIKYFIYNNNERQSERLITKARSIQNYISSNPETAKRNINLDEIQALINRLSNLFNNEIFIYNNKGELVSSTKNEIFIQGILARQINHEALLALVKKNETQFLHSESIGNMNYLSCYVPVLNRNHQIVFLVNIPYFSQQAELNKEISNFIVNFLNIYAILTIGIVIFSIFAARSITQPLSLLRSSLLGLKLDRPIELLEWKSNDEIGDLIKQYNKTALDLAESKENLARAERTQAWQEMAKQVAHDIKNPLTPMKLNLQYLQKAMKENDPEVMEKFRRVADSLITQIDSMASLANEFSSFAKIPEGKPEVFEITNELQRIVHMYEISENVLFEFHQSAEPLKIKMDKNQFARVIGNLLKNAIQALPQDEKGKIIISEYQKEGNVIISIQDNGHGIPQDQHQKIFLPNFSTKSSGMGIGLSMCKTIVEQAEGKISFTSTENEGTTFFVTLPPAKLE